MRMTAFATVLVAAGVGVASIAPVAAAPDQSPRVREQVDAAKASTRQVSVAGAGVDMYPSFSSAVRRYGVRTTTATAGSVRVEATTSDASGRVWVDGRLATGDTTTVSGLVPGDEISVFIQDSSGSVRYWLVYLPAGFPRIIATTKQAGIAPGLVGMSLSQWNEPTPNFEVAVDVNGVPAYVHSTTGATIDLKRQPNGHYSTSRLTTTAGRTGHALVELDGSFKEVARHETVGLVNTDGHDSILQPDGSRILLAYEPNADTGLVDSVIQEIDPDGDVVFEWNSGDAGLAAESVYPVGTADYAHINSVTVMADGDLLASFRHLSSVLKIARTAHDGFAAGDIVWRLGGENSDFTFVDDPYPGGPCAQHTASELPNGNILVYDNGSGVLSPNMCIDPANPNVPIARAQTRVTEYALDHEADTATLTWDYTPGRFGLFAGSAARLGNGNTLVGWAAVRQALATELNAAGETVWELKVDSPDGAPLYSTYRAAKFAVPDVIDPQVTVKRPAAGATYDYGQRVKVDVRCTDRGGSGLTACAGSNDARSGTRLDTTRPGRHVFDVVATDGHGNQTTVRRSYRVGPLPYRPDASVRHSSGRWLGDGVYGGPSRQDVRLGTRSAVSTVARLENDGAKADRIRVRGTRGSKQFRVRYLVGGKDVTTKVIAGTYRTNTLTPDERLNLRVRVTRLRAADQGDSRRFVLTATSIRDPRLRDKIAVVVRVKR